MSVDIQPQASRHLVSPNNLDAIFYDCDGTLVKKPIEWFRSLMDVMNLFDAPISWRDFPKYNGMGKLYRRMIVEHGLPCDEPLFHELVESSFTERTNGRVEPTPGALKALRRFATKIPQFVVSSGNKQDVEERLTSAGMTPYISEVIGGDQVERGKPHGDIILFGARIGGFNPTRILVVGDSGNDVLSSEDAGAKSVWLRYGRKSRMLRDSNIKPTATIRNLNQLTWGLIERIGLEA